MFCWEALGPRIHVDVDTQHPLKHSYTPSWQQPSLMTSPDVNPIKHGLGWAGTRLMEAPNHNAEEPKNPPPTSWCQTPQDIPRDPASIPRWVRAAMLARGRATEHSAGGFNAVADLCVIMHNRGGILHRFTQVIQNYDISKSQHKTRITTLTADTTMHVNIASVVSYSIYRVDSGSARWYQVSNAKVNRFIFRGWNLTSNRFAVRSRH